MLGKLSWAAIPLDQPIPLIAGSVVIFIVLAVIAWIVLNGHLPYLWREWITSVDHKRIGVIYMLLGLLMLIRGFIDAIMMLTGNVRDQHGRRPVISRPNTMTKSSRPTVRS